MSKKILITGSTDGIGLLAAKMLHADGHEVLLHGRSAAKLEAARQALGGAAGYRADLSSLDETRAMAEAFLSDHDTLDVLINNAGILKTSNPLAGNGQDVRFVVNSLAPYVLSKAILPIIPKSGRILNLSSAAQDRVNIAALKGGVAQGDMEAYAQSKLAITIWSQEMAKALPGGPVVIAVNPGSLLATKMVKEGFGIAGSDAAIGAEILRRLSLEAAFVSSSGKYWDNDSGVFGPIHPAGQDPKHITEVMAAIEAMVA